MFEGYRPHIKAAQEGKPLEFPASLGEEPFTTSETLFRTIQYLAEVQKETSGPAPISVQGPGANSKLLTRLLQRHIASFRKIVKEIDDGVDDGLPSDDETGDVELDYVRDLLESYDTTISWLKTWEPTILSGGLRRAIQDRPDQHIEHADSPRLLSAFCQSVIMREKGFPKLSADEAKDLPEVQASVISANMVVKKLIQAKEEKESTGTT